MRRSCTHLLLVCTIILSGFATVGADNQAEFARIRDVIYGKKYGMALTMDVFTPAKNANGAAVIAVISFPRKTALTNS